MKNFKNNLLVITAIFAFDRADAQGFVNLNFESANVSAYQPDSDDVPPGLALPGWNGFYGNALASQLWYDGISIGGAIISVIDNKAPAFAPLQGSYSAFLFGGEGVSASISQTGVIPVGAQSLLMKAMSFGAAPVVAVNGQQINMTPVQTFPNYTLYGGDISSYDGMLGTLSFTEPPPATGSPSGLLLDGISFSTTAVPEPSPLMLTGAAGMLFAAYRRCTKRP